MKTDITLVIDCSGSMVSIKKDMEGAINTALKEQAKDPDPCSITVCADG